MALNTPAKPKIEGVMDDRWALYVTNTMIDILARDKGVEITKRVLTPKAQRTCTDSRGGGG